MTTLHDKIAALPEWPEDLAGYPPPDDAEWNDYLHEKIGCVLARLALAREWIEDAHLSYCQQEMTCGKYPCDCGRNALLKALEAKPCDHEYVGAHCQKCGHELYEL